MPIRHKLFLFNRFSFDFQNRPAVIVAAESAGIMRLQGVIAFRALIQNHLLQGEMGTAFSGPAMGFSLLRISHKILD
jgi:hypothetical protein